MGLTISIADVATPAVRAFVAQLSRPAPANRAAAEGALPIVKRNFLSLAGSERNRFGVRGGFWGRMIAGTKAGADETTGFLRMPREVAARRFGATIKPSGDRKYLAIPARAEAYGKSPRDFPALRFIPTRSGGMLVQAQNTHAAQGGSGGRGGKGKGKLRAARADETATHGQGAIMYWLVKEVVIRANAAVLPTDEEIVAGAIGGLNSWVSTLLARRAQ